MPGGWRNRAQSLLTGAREPVAAVLYHQGGQPREVSQAIRDGALGSNQVLVRHRNGLQVAANCNAGQPWTVSLGGGEQVLSGFFWAASGPDLREFCTMEEGRRLSYVASPA
jgi:hypothetical protein